MEDNDRYIHKYGFGRIRYLECDKDRSYADTNAYTGTACRKPDIDYLELFRNDRSTDIPDIYGSGRYAC